MSDLNFGKGDTQTAYPTGFRWVAFSTKIPGRINNKPIETGGLTKRISKKLSQVSSVWPNCKKLWIVMWIFCCIKSVNQTLQEFQRRSGNIHPRKHICALCICSTKNHPSPKHNNNYAPNEATTYLLTFKPRFQCEWSWNWTMCLQQRGGWQIQLNNDRGTKIRLLCMSFVAVLNTTRTKLKHYTFYSWYWLRSLCKSYGSPTHVVSVCVCGPSQKTTHLSHVMAAMF